MKTFVLILLCITSLSYSQNKINLSDSNNDNLALRELPEIVLTKIGDDFSIYLPDKHPDLHVQQMEDFFISYDLGKDYEGFDNYLVIMRNDKGTLTARYNQKGKLINVIEKYESITLPNEVLYSVSKNYPGWDIVKDKYLYAQSDGHVDKKEYSIKIKNDKKTKKLLLSSNGEILKE
ncbi:hypothetical protein [Flavobacterium sp.]|jgi:hypothetical protein|uniref:hypothetical protein n=1 Tax=Flavobacterium sp. TaxID=239 RepID=UPI002A8256A3|nr:hypothetical protein [Flavobacterium sp.]